MSLFLIRPFKGSKYSCLVLVEDTKEELYKLYRTLKLKTKAPGMALHMQGTMEVDKFGRRKETKCISWLMVHRDFVTIGHIAHELSHVVHHYMNVRYGRYAPRPFKVEYSKNGQVAFSDKDEPEEVFARATDSYNEMFWKQWGKYK